MKIFKITVIALLFSTSTFAQNRIGIYTGINGTGLTYDFFGVFSFQQSVGFHVGGLYEFKINDKFFIRPNIVFSQQGDRNKTYSDDSPYINNENIDYKLDYLNLPIDFGYQLDNINFFIGPQIGFLLNKNKMSLDLGDPNYLDFGVNLGFGLKSIANNLFVNFKIYQGISTILKVEYYNPGGVYKHNITNQVIQLNIGYYLN